MLVLFSTTGISDDMFIYSLGIGRGGARGGFSQRGDFGPPETVLGTNLFRTALLSSLRFMYA